MKSISSAAISSQQISGKTITPPLLSYPQRSTTNSVASIIAEAVMYNRWKINYARDCEPAKISQKLCESIKIAMKSFSKNLAFGDDFKL